MFTLLKGEKLKPSHFVNIKNSTLYAALHSRKIVLYIKKRKTPEKMQAQMYTFLLKNSDMPF